MTTTLPDGYRTYTCKLDWLAALPVLYPDHTLRLGKTQPGVWYAQREAQYLDGQHMQTYTHIIGVWQQDPRVENWGRGWITLPDA